MKKKCITTKAAIAAATLMISLSGCFEKDLSNPIDDAKTNDSELNGFFDFATTKAMKLQVKYDLPENYGALFEVYDANPLSLDKDGQIEKSTELKPLVISSTDLNGKYSGELTVPASMKEIYIYSSSAGVPAVLKADISGGAVSLSEANILDGGVATRAADTYAASKTVSDRGSFLTLGTNNAITWEPLGGKPLNVDAAETAKFNEIQTSVLTAVNAVLREGSRPTGLEMGGDYKTDLVTKDAKVYLRYVCGKSSSMGTLAYYCYPKGAKLTKEYIESLPKAVVFANTLDVSWDSKNSSLERGTCVELKYINDKGEVTDEQFPEGTHIGFVLYNNGYRKNFGPSITAFNLTQPFYSTPVTNGGNRFGHTATFSYNNNEMVLVGFEDWTGDYDYNDFVFNVTGVEGTNYMEEEVVSISGGVTRGTLAFEDNWPNEGDYDMNDVIVKYSSESFYTLTTYLGTAKVAYSKEKMVDTYKLVWTGASYKNGFGYKVKLGDDVASIKVTRNGKEVSEPAIETEPDGSKVIMLLTDARKEIGVESLDPKDMSGITVDEATFVITTTYSNVPESQVPVFNDRAPYNPFITVNGNRSKEVHLINYAPTSKMDTSLFSKEGSNDVSDPATGKYYHNRDFWPFAINVDASGSNQSAWEINKKLSQYESVRIDKSYPNFTKWANSKGNESTTWWK